MLQGTNFMKPLSEQLDTVLPQLDKHADAVDTAIPFYLAVTAKLSGKSADEFYSYCMQALELIYHSSHEGKTPKELAESAYAYAITGKSRQIFDKLAALDK